jgi:uncharacterized protein
MIDALVNRLIYRPELTEARKEFTPDDLSLLFEDVTFVTQDEIRLTGWYVFGRKPQHALLYCHGNAGNRRDWINAAPDLVAMGCGVLVFDYRGYGDSDGRPSESGLYLDGEAAWAWLKGRADTEGIPASILGKSLGSAVAVHVSSRAQPHCLILDSAFTSMDEVIRARVPWLARILIPRRYASIEKVPLIDCPTLVLHGERDKLVPPVHALRLYGALRAPKIMRMIEGVGHNDIDSSYQYHNWVKCFLADPLGLIAEQEETSRSNQ